MILEIVIIHFFLLKIQFNLLKRGKKNLTVIYKIFSVSNTKMATSLNNSEVKKNTSYLQVELAVHRLALRVDKLECVASISIHLSVPIRSTSVAEEKRNL